MDVISEFQADNDHARQERGADYLAEISRWTAEDVWLRTYQSDRAMLAWIGSNIQAINRKLRGYLQDCQSCFAEQTGEDVQILAAPLAAEWRVDGFCNLQTQPVTILIDVGRVSPDYWLALVAHEYCHARLGTPGHGEPFYRLLCHICLGLGIPRPSWNELTNAQLAHWPYCPPSLNSLNFWRGHSSKA